MTTIKDIAKASGVSYPTVSHVLNNTRKVSPQTQARVRLAIEQLDYHPNAVARGLLKKRMNTLGVLFPYAPSTLTSNHYLGPLVDGIMGAAQARHQSVTFFTADEYPETMQRLPLYRDGRTDGLIVIGQPTDTRFVTHLGKTPFPFVCVNERWEGATVPAVDVDQAGTAKMLTAYLLGLGHRRIAIFCGGSEAVSVAQRRQGCRDAFAEYGIPFPEDSALPGAYTEQSGYDRARTLLKDCRKEDRPTALFCMNDHIAFGAIKALLELGLRVPEDISVVGIDDVQAAAASTPALTTMHLPLREIGERAVAILMAQIEKEEGIPRQELLPTRLIVRQSTAPPGE